MQINLETKSEFRNIWVFVQSPDVKFITDHDELNLGVLWSDSISINSCKVENVDV